MGALRSAIPLLPISQTESYRFSYFPLLSVHMKAFVLHGDRIEFTTQDAKDRLWALARKTEIELPGFDHIVLVGYGFGHANVGGLNLLHCHDFAVLNLHSKLVSKQVFTKTALMRLRNEIGPILGRALKSAGYGQITIVPEPFMAKSPHGLGADKNNLNEHDQTLQNFRISEQLKVIELGYQQLEFEIGPVLRQPPQTLGADRASTRFEFVLGDKDLGQLRHGNAQYGQHVMAALLDLFAGRASGGL